MRFIVLILLTFSLNAFAQKRLGSNAFQSNVRPVLAAILNDFYQMVSQFPEFPKELNVVVQNLDKLQIYKELLIEHCPRTLNTNCQSSVEQLRVQLSNIQSQLYELSAKQRMSKGLHLTPLPGMRTMGILLNEVEMLKGYLDNSSFMIKASIPHKRSSYEIVKGIDTINTFASLTFVEYIPYMYKEEFKHFYFNFVQPIQLQISKLKNYEFLNRNINSLNFSLNLLVQSLTKRNKKTPEGMSSYLQLMHNRWNSLFRYYL